MSVRIVKNHNMYLTWLYKQSTSRWCQELYLLLDFSFQALQLNYMGKNILAEINYVFNV